MDIVCVNSNAWTVVNGSVVCVHLIGKSILTNPATLKSVWPMIDKIKKKFKILTEFRNRLQYAMNSYVLSQKYFYVLLIETTKITNISYWNVREWSDYFNDNLNWSLQVSVSDGNRYSRYVIDVFPINSFVCCFLLFIHLFACGNCVKTTEQTKWLKFPFWR